MAFGLPNASDLNVIVANLGTIVANAGPEVAEAMKPIIEQIEAHAEALEDKAIAAEKEAEDPILQRLDRIIVLGEKFEGFSAGFDISVRPKATQ